MPILEILHSAREPLTIDQKKQFAAECVRIFQEILGTPEGRLRLFYTHIAPQDTIEELLNEPLENSPSTSAQ